MVKVWHAVLSWKIQHFRWLCTQKLDTNCVPLCSAQEFLNGIWDCQKRHVFLKAPSKIQPIHKTIPLYYLLSSFEEREEGECALKSLE